ncbi:FAD binding domain-containing protein [Dactylonectria macrodidyma]|uniref:FAD binding domain-containing protein n=1 Tax=Dactylonectria macrodidyma TaxID=307937 RepID=A0A9P9D9K7_9HYPO|nr:FAD binding domain-containing protein [Dactylonectria macrodidyma]
MQSEDVFKVDVLIIGAGPSGLMLATWLARMGVKTHIVDKRFDRINSGRAIGHLIWIKNIMLTSTQIFDSLGFGQDIWREANHMLEIRVLLTASENPNEENELYRSDRIVDTMPGVSRFQQATLHQARIEDYLFRYIEKFSDIKVEHGREPESLAIDAEKVETDDYPVSITLRHLPKPATEFETLDDTQKPAIPNGLYRSNLVADTTAGLLQSTQEVQGTRTEKILAKYVVGCDGAHSWTRRQIGSVMEGEQTDYIWGVLDIIPITDFPDVRYRCAIHSTSGSMMIIPRENKFVRLYIQVTEVDEHGKAIDRFKIGPETLLQAANKILAPYKMSYQHCHWWTAYRIGQRVGSKFSAHERVFLAGDAVHTHSPKAGQGMNISMHDTYNLGWKLAYVIKGWANRSLLKTYVIERRQIAKELIEFDQRFSRLFSGRPAKDIMDKEGIDLKTFKQVFEKGNLFASGCAVDYAPSLIITKPHTAQNATSSRVPGVIGKQALAPNIPIGMRIPSHKVLNQSDARPWHLQERLPSNGTWRVIVFGGDVLNPVQLARCAAFAKALSSPDSFVNRYKPKGDERLSSFYEIITIHSSAREKVDLLTLPDIFHPYSPEYGWDYEKVYVDDVSYHEGHGQAYANYGIDPSRGCVVIVRPDQYVSWIGELEDVDDMNRFFASIFTP